MDINNRTRKKRGERERERETRTCLPSRLYSPSACESPGPWFCRHLFSAPRCSAPLMYREQLVQSHLPRARKQSPFTISLPHRNYRSRLSVSVASFLSRSLSKATSTRLCEGLESSAERLGWHTAHHSSMINEEWYFIHNMWHLPISDLTILSEWESIFWFEQHLTT